MSVAHDFEEQLAYSEEASQEAFWDAVYRKAFPTLVNHMPCPGDVESQRMGIDRLILLSNGQTLKIDEKKRRKDRNDVLLEYVSVDTTGAPGWVEKDLAIDYIAYAFMPSRQCLLMPWPQLRRAWFGFKDQWLRKYKIPPVPNKGYHTLCVAVPIPVLQNAIAKASLIRV